jgi:hypothetical protein
MVEVRSAEFKAYDIVRILAEKNAPSAMQSIVFLSMHSTNEATRLKAAQYVIDRSCGRIADLPANNGIDDEFKALLAGVLKEGNDG